MLPDPRQRRAVDDTTPAAILRRATDLAANQNPDPAQVLDLAQTITRSSELVGTNFIPRVIAITQNPGSRDISGVLAEMIMVARVATLEAAVSSQAAEIDALNKRMEIAVQRENDLSHVLLSFKQAYESHMHVVNGLVPGGTRWQSQQFRGLDHPNWYKDFYLPTEEEVDDYRSTSKPVAWVMGKSGPPWLHKDPQSLEPK